jgi:CubicO group peptidase (beta-lactamase class C family)
VTNAGSTARQASFRCAVRKHDITGLRVLRHGEVLTTVGAQDVPYPVHSIRKSIVGALFGRLIERKLVRLDTTLAELGIDDVPQLTPLERSATLEHLLMSSSGVYLPLNFETSFDIFTNRPANWPTRGCAAPGESFHYSNWDFNVLGEIYQRVCGIALFVAIDRLLAEPLAFQDWNPLEHTRLSYLHDPLGATPRFPNYAIRLSVRDLARFGQLYLEGGVSDCEQIVPTAWITQSTRPIVETGLPSPFQHYGYLWWSIGDNDTSPLPQGSYCAIGLGGQILSVVPSYGVVIVAMCAHEHGDVAPMTMADDITQVVLGLVDETTDPNTTLTTQPGRSDGDIV